MICKCIGWPYLDGVGLPYRICAIAEGSCMDFWLRSVGSRSATVARVVGSITICRHCTVPGYLRLVVSGIANGGTLGYYSSFSQWISVHAAVTRQSVGDYLWWTSMITVL